MPIWQCQCGQYAQWPMPMVFRSSVRLSRLQDVSMHGHGRSFRPNFACFSSTRTTHAPRHSPHAQHPHHAPTEHGPHAHQPPPAGRRTRARHTYAPATPCLSRVSTFPLTNNSRSRAWHTGSRRSSEWAPPCAPGAPPPASAAGAALQPRGRSPPRATEQ